MPRFPNNGIVIPTQNVISTFNFPYACYISCRFHPAVFNPIWTLCEIYKLCGFLVHTFLESFVIASLLWIKCVATNVVSTGYYVYSFHSAALWILTISCIHLQPDPNVVEAQTPEGLIKGHAYSITKVKYVDIQTPRSSGKIPLIRIRNPWGNEAEWTGAWGDKWVNVSDNEWLQSYDVAYILCISYSDMQIKTQQSQFPLEGFSWNFIPSPLHTWATDIFIDPRRWDW